MKNRTQYTETRCSQNITWLCRLLSFILLSVTGIHAQTENTYRLSSVDQIEMTIFQQPKMNIKQRLDGQGNVSLPLIGATHLGGLTLAEAEKKIAVIYKNERYLKEPSITLSIIDYSPKSVIVMGEVEEPGEIKLPAEANTIAISKAIAMAGGFTNTAKQSSVKVVRLNDAGNRISYQVDVSESYEKGDKKSQQKSQLKPGDTVIVPKRIF